MLRSIKILFRTKVQIIVLINDCCNPSSSPSFQNFKCSFRLWRRFWRKGAPRSPKLDEWVPEGTLEDVAGLKISQPFETRGPFCCIGMLIHSSFYERTDKGCRFWAHYAVFSEFRSDWGRGSRPAPTTSSNVDPKFEPIILLCRTEPEAQGQARPWAWASPSSSQTIQLLFQSSHKDNDC